MVDAVTAGQSAAEDHSTEGLAALRARVKKLREAGSTPARGGDGTSTNGVLTHGDSTPTVTHSLEKQPSWLKLLDSVERHCYVRLDRSAFSTLEELLTRLRENPDGPERWLALLAHLRSAAVKGQVPTGSIVRLYESATRNLDRRTHRRNRAYVQLWLSYAGERAKESTEDARDAFKYMRAHRIGDDTAELYETWALFETQNGNADKAKKLFEEAASKKSGQGVVEAGGERSDAGSTRRSSRHGQQPRSTPLRPEAGDGEQRQPKKRSRTPATARKTLLSGGPARRVRHGLSSEPGAPSAAAGAAARGDSAAEAAMPDVSDMEPSGLEPGGTGPTRPAGPSSVPDTLRSIRVDVRAAATESAEPSTDADSQEVAATPSISSAVKRLRLASADRNGRTESWSSLWTTYEPEDESHSSGSDSPELSRQSQPAYRERDEPVLYFQSDDKPRGSTGTGTGPGSAQPDAGGGAVPRSRAQLRSAPATASDDRREPSRAPSSAARAPHGSPALDQAADPELVRAPGAARTARDPPDPAGGHLDGDGDGDEGEGEEGRLPSWDSGRVPGEFDAADAAGGAAPPAPAPAPVPSVLNAMSDALVQVNDKQYLRLEMVGRGGSSKVYKVMGPDRKIYALKKVRVARRDQNTISSYANEIRLLRRLRGKTHIVQLFDAGVREEAGLIHMVMEFGDIDLARLLARGRGKPVNTNFLRLYWQQMLEAVHTIHEERIVHGDLKPANFLLVEGALKLIDFGIAKAIQNDDTTNIVRDSQVGTPNYMSPEALLCAPGDGAAADEPRAGNAQKYKLGRASDIWSLGCILYQMVFGRTPFAHLSMIQKLHCITDPRYEIQFPAVRNSYLLEDLRSCLQRDPARRPTIPELLRSRFLFPDQRHHRDVGGAHEARDENAAPVLSRDMLTSILDQIREMDVNMPEDVLSDPRLVDRLLQQLGRPSRPPAA